MILAIPVHAVSVHMQTTRRSHVAHSAMIVTHKALPSLSLLMGGMQTSEDTPYGNQMDYYTHHLALKQIKKHARSLHVNSQPHPHSRPGSERKCKNSYTTFASKTADDIPSKQKLLLRVTANAQKHHNSTECAG